MIPILYEAEENQFRTQGIGRLSDVIAGSVKRRINGFYELRMTYPITGAFASDLKPLRMLYVSHDDTGECEPFEIYSVSKPSNGKIEVLAWHNYYKLGKIVARPFYGESIQTALVAFKNSAMSDCPFTFESDVTTAGRLEFNRPVAMQSIMGGIEGSFLDVYGGEWDFNNFACYLRGRIGSDKDVTIRYGKNLLTAQNKLDTTNLWSGIVPFWYKDGEGLIYYDGIIKSPIADSLPHDMVVAIDASQAFESKPTAKQLLAWGQSYVTNNAKKAIPQSITVSFANLSQTEEYEEYKRLERLSIGDGVNVFYEDLDIEGYSRIVETDWDFVNDKYNKMVLGEVRANFAKSVNSTLKETTSNILRQVPSRAWFENELDEATKRITGATGGRKVDLFDSEGRPNGTVFIDTDTIETATKGMLINYEGIGFSTDIPNWNFNSAWTIDGTLDMQNINVIHMRANIIKAGILADVAGKNFWNMETGEFSLQASAKVGNKTVQEIADGSANTALSSAKSYSDGNLSAAKTFASNAAAEAVNAQTQQSIFNKLTNNGETQGIYLSGGKVYINASYIHSGTLVLGGLDNGNGRLRLLDASGNEVGSFDNTGVVAKAGEIGGFSVSDTEISQYTSDAKWVGMSIKSGKSSSGNTSRPGIVLKNLSGSSQDGVMSYGGYQMDLGFTNNSYSPWVKFSAILNSAVQTFSEVYRIDVDKTDDTKYHAAHTIQDVFAIKQQNATSNKGIVFGINRSSGVAYGGSIQAGEIIMRPLNSVNIQGSLYVAGGTKNRLVETENYSKRLLNAYETTSPMFGDIGEGEIGEDGLCYIWIDPIFLQTVSIESYQVFLQKYGAGDLWVKEGNKSCFIVEGTPKLKFGWELKAKQKGFENKRLDEPGRDNGVGEEYYGTEAEIYLQKLREGRY